MWRGETLGVALECNNNNHNNNHNSDALLTTGGVRTTQPTSSLKGLVFFKV